MLNGITARLCRLGSILIALAALASPALAEPGNGRWSGGGYVVVNGGNRGSCAPAPAYRPRVMIHGDACGCDACCVKREYARGFNRGEAAGSNQGFRDGVNGRPFCAELRDDLRCESRAYQDGYMKSFGNAYRCAFEQGRSERNRVCKPSAYRPRCPW